VAFDKSLTLKNSLASDARAMEVHLPHSHYRSTTRT
jgi:hypothetical protein